MHISIQKIRNGFLVDIQQPMDYSQQLVTAIKLGAKEMKRDEYMPDNEPEKDVEINGIHFFRTFDKVLVFLSELQQ